MAKLDLKSAAQREADEEAKGRQAYLRVHGPGPKLRRCEECGAFACYGLNDFGRLRPIDAPPPEYLCEKHAPDSLKRPGDFLKAPRS